MKLPSRLIIFALAISTVAGCQTFQPAVTPQIVVGTYSYVSQDPEVRATDYNLNRLELRFDGTYDLVEGGTKKAATEKKGDWRLEPDTPSGVVDVLLDHAGYPVQINQNEVRLLIDLDTGIWWSKPRRTSSEEATAKTPEKRGYR
jgi:hypothetical protein